MLRNRRPKDNDGPTRTSPAPDSATVGGLSPSLRVLLTLAAATVALAGVYFLRAVFGPVALAIVIVIICEPLRRPLDRRGWPRWASTTAVIALAYLILVAMGALLWLAGTQFARLITDLVSEGGLNRAADQLVSTLQSLGLDAEASDAAASVLDPETLLGLVRSVGGTVLSVATALFFVCAYIIFMAVDAARYRQAPALFAATEGATIERIVRLNSGIRRYYVVNATFGAIVAVIDGLALWWMGIPVPIVWAILAFVTNFIPNIGFILGLVPPAILAFVVGDWPLLLAVVAVYCVVNVVLQVLVQPKFVSDAVDLSLTLSFLSVIFWTFIIGPLGAILSIPLTLLVRSLVLEGDPSTTWLRWLSGDRTAIPPEVRPAEARPGTRPRRRRAARDDRAADR
ncbi:AI-2E family transporter [Microbacterium sp. APC 3901]|uniref:AI-2E family transporter n=1 Tax=Microbacterium sp. APC 3901 TaxID=3035192 RepID=UPI0025B2AC8B|nr:AI-2E family transporter [Microbacterium sp. APC 3901]MDN3443438.1 AI-2E family transporter [Microbacterium sp. APC 3901]